MPPRKAPAMHEPIPHDVTSLAVMVGEMRGQLRELVHTTNNVSTKIDGLTREVIAMGPLAAELAELKAEIKVAQSEIAALKSERDQRKGAVGLIDWSVKHWPGVLGFLFLIVIILRSGEVKL
jgi:septal ring factor EnvC (AmiA/AmiB activator)